MKEILKSKSAIGLNAFVNPLNSNENVFDSSGLEQQVNSKGYDYQKMRADGYSDEEIKQATGV